MLRGMQLATLDIHLAPGVKDLTPLRACR